MLSSALAFLAFAQAPATTAQGYRLPPREIVEVLDAPSTPDLDLSPDGRWMLFTQRPAMPSIADVAREWVGLGGSRIDPARHAAHQVAFSTGLLLRALDESTERKLELPSGARIGAVSWSPKSDRIVFTLARADGIDLWTCATDAGAPRKLVADVNNVLGSPFDWSYDGTFLVVKVAERAAAPAQKSAPDGPAIQETSGKAGALRTFQDLLRDEDDAALFEHYGRSKLVRVDVASGEQRELAPASLFSDLAISPDGRHVLVTRVERPFSYVLPWSSFPETTEVLSIDGKLERRVVSAPLADDIPVEGVRTGPRSVQWQASAPATLWWVEAQDGGDPKRAAPERDRWMRLEAPFAGDAQAAFALQHRAQGLRWMPDPTRVIANEFDRDRRWVRASIVDLASKDAPRQVVEDRNRNDRYGDPGAFASRPGELGTRVLRIDGGFAYRIGQGASKDGARPFLDRVELQSGAKERLWQCGEGVYETLVAIVRSSATAKPAIVTSRESPTEPPNYHLIDLESGAKKALTSFGDPQPRLRSIRQELVKYKRADGVELSAKLYVPSDRKEGERLPLFVWAYPMEFTDGATAGQVAGSPHRFVRVRGPSQLLFALHGYAVMDDASMPVVGDPETMNDTFVQQIVSSAQAAIDEAVRRGVADPARVAVGGHSYGAFMTAHLLAHCDLFKAGVARSGAYNRSLTPFGFQSERRTLWEAPEIYVKLSPFFVAQKVNEPMLMIHGEKDSNPGTFPIQSERMYQAVKGNGGTARLVFLPGEDHGYAARESVLHTVAEMFEWCDRYVRDAAPNAGSASGATRPVEASGSR